MSGCPARVNPHIPDNGDGVDVALLRQAERQWTALQFDNSPDAAFVPVKSISHSLEIAGE